MCMSVVTNNVERAEQIPTFLESACFISEILFSTRNAVEVVVWAFRAVLCGD